MGVDLSLYPVKYSLETGEELSFSILSLERRRELWPLIEEIESHPVKEATGHFGDNYRTITKDPYGTPLRYVRAKDLLALQDNEAVQDNNLNRAAWAYLSAIAPETKIILYWH